MFARKCDRCGKLYENYYDVNGNALYAFCRNDNGEALDKEVYVKDLCPECMEKYRQFMDGWIPIEPDRFSESEVCEREVEILKREVERLKERESPVVLDGDKIIQAMEQAMGNEGMPCDAPESSYSGD